MIGRRDLLIGSACGAAAAAAYVLKPRRNVALLGKDTLAAIVPTVVGPWTSRDVGDPLALNGEGTLSAKLYNELLVRLYVNATTSTEILMLLAYGGRQTDELQLHRPEICYPAFGYELLRNEPLDVVLRGDVTVPSRRLIADSGQSKESIVYWTRMGEYLPATAGAQREDRLKVAMQGIIPDGLLSRFSVNLSRPSSPWRDLEAFIPLLIDAIAPQHRRVLIGSTRANSLRGLVKETGKVRLKDTIS